MMDEDIAEQILNIYKQDHLKDLTYISFPNKYDDQFLSFKDSHWNFPLCNLWDNTVSREKDFKDFYAYLGKRIALCLNLQQGKSNEELQEEYEKTRIS